MEQVTRTSLPPLLDLHLDLLVDLLQGRAIL